MTPQRWQQIKNLTNSALEQDAEQRAAALHQSCADDLPLRRGVEALLSFHEQATRNLANAPAHAAFSAHVTLSPEQWERIERLFQSAIELDPAKRAAFLGEVCGDDERVRHEVESLLVYQAAAGGLIGDAIEQAAGLLANDAAAKARFTPGTTLNKRYRIIGLLGKGGMGEVYRADDLKLGHPVALKFLTEKLSQDKAMLARFHSEVSMAHRVTHPNVCRVHDIGDVTTSSGNLHFLSMEYVDGEDLSSLLRRIGHLPADKAVEIANQLCAGLAAAHEAGVLHRDLKPANVMIDGKGRVRITDFGLAGFAEQIRGEEVFAGTPAYMSPEQFAGKEVTTKSDIYALGLVLYEIFTGKRVFEAGSLDELRRLHESSSPTNPSNWVKDIDPLVERVILRCLEKEPAKRLASAKQVADALPGGDPLAAALALGETPSPEMVAAAGAKTGLRPPVAVACLAAIIVLLAAFMWVNGNLMLISRVPMENPPEALARRARELAVQFGYAEKPTDTAYGFAYDLDLISYSNGTRGNRSLLSRERLATGRPTVFEYWYRESPLYLQGFKADRERTGSVTLDDPAQDISRMVAMRLDPIGRLRYFAAVPPQIEQPSPQAASPASPFDRAGLFAAAGLDQSRFTTAEAQWTPPAAFDERAAWTGTYPDQPDVPIRLELAAYRGRLVWFQMIEPWSKPERMPSSQQTSGLNWIGIIIYLVVDLTAIALAWKHYRLGRGDRRGAFKLASFYAITALLAWILQIDHAPTIQEFSNFMAVVSTALYDGLFMWSIYMALEPLIRRRLPETIITWSRLLAGQFRNPLLGRDVMIGILAASGYLVVDLLVRWSTAMTRGAALQMDSLLDTRHNLWVLIASLGIAPDRPVTLLILFFLLRWVLRKQWLGIACLILVFSLPQIFGVISGTGRVIGLLLVILQLSVEVFLLLRFGLVAGCLYTFSSLMLNAYPVTYNFSAWYAGSGMFAVGVLLALAGYAFYTSLGGQKVFAGKLLEE